MKNQNLLKKLFFSLNGLKVAFKSEHSLKIELLSGIFAIFSMWFFEANVYWFIGAIFCISCVLSSELINTAFEYFLDKHYPKIDPTTGNIKDILSSAVFIFQFMSFIYFILFLNEYLF